MSTCAAPGCTAPLGRRNRWGFCPKHSPTAYPCRVGGCTGRAAAYSTTHLCHEHRTLAEPGPHVPSAARHYRPGAA